MTKKKKDLEEQPVQDTPTEAADGAQETAPEDVQEASPESAQVQTETEQLRQELETKQDQYLRLAAEYENFRKRSAREKDRIYQDARAETVKKFLPVYDNLERALKNETADGAYKKGVEMTMNELTKIMQSFGIAPFGAAGETFDPQLHNAVMHIEDETLGENVIAEVFQTGFAMGEQVIRFAMVKVAN